MKYNLIDTTGVKNGTSNLHKAGANLTLVVTGGTANTLAFDTYEMDAISAIFLGSNSTGSAETFTYPGTGNALVVGTQALALGQLVTATTSGTLPTGIATGTNYYAIPLTGTSLSIASSYANAVAGTAITLSGSSTNVGTFTPTALAGSCVINTQVSNDNINFVTLGSSTIQPYVNGTMTGGTTPINVNYDRPQYHFVRWQITGITAGAVTITPQVIAKSDRYQ